MLRHPAVADSPEIAWTLTLTAAQEGNCTDDYDGCEDSEEFSQRHSKQSMGAFRSMRNAKRRSCTRISMDDERKERKENLGISSLRPSRTLRSSESW